MRYFTSDLHLAHPFVAATRGFWKPGMRPDRDVIEAPDGINQLRRELSEYRFNEMVDTEAHDRTIIKRINAVCGKNDETTTARAVFGHSPHRPARSLRSRADVRFPSKGSIRITGASLVFLPRCSGIPRNRSSNSAPTFEGLFEVFRWVVLRPFRAPVRTEPPRRSFGGLSLGFGWHA